MPLQDCSVLRRIGDPTESPGLDRRQPQPRHLSDPAQNPACYELQRNPHQTAPPPRVSPSRLIGLPLPAQRGLVCRVSPPELRHDVTKSIAKAVERPPSASRSSRDYNNPPEGWVEA